MRKSLLTLSLLACSGLIGCAPQSIPWGHSEVSAKMAPLRGGYGTGTLLFEQQGKYVHISGTLSGLAPGAHGLHIHTRKDCSGSAASAVDPHFNPTRKRHGDLSRQEHHAGDLPMLVAGKSGQAKYDVLLDWLKLSGGDEGIIGRAVVLKAGPDDHTTQPGGNAGPGVSCGIIERR